MTHPKSDNNMMLTCDTKCQHEYLPDEDGTVYTCGSDDEVTEDKETGLFLCCHHRNDDRNWEQVEQP